MNKLTATVPLHTIAVIMLRRWPYLIPPVYLGLILWVQPADRIVMPWTAEALNYPLPPNLSRWVTDDCDLLAYAMRAENAARGRKAGLKDAETGKPYEPWNEADERHAKLLDRYFLEYPPAALTLFRLGHIGSCRDPDAPVPVKYLDCHQALVGAYTPRTEAEHNLICSYRHAMRVYAILLTVGLLTLMLLVDVGFGAAPEARIPLWLLILPSFLYFSLCRFDLLPAGLVLASILAGDRKRVWLAGLALGLAVALKTYPLAVAPILLRYSARTWGQALAWCVGAALPVLGSYGILFATDGWDGIILPLKFQLERPLEPMWCFFGRIFPEAFAGKTLAASLVRGLPIFLAALLFSLSRPADVPSTLRRCAVVVTLFISLQTFFSPQWGQWLAVLIIPLVRKHPWLVGFIVVHDLWSYLYFPLMFDLGVIADGPWESLAWTASVHTWIRAMLYFTLLASLLWHETHKPRVPQTDTLTV